VSAPPVEVAEQLRPRTASPFGLGFRSPEPGEETTPAQPGTIPSPASSPEESSAHEPAQGSGLDYDEVSEQSESRAGTSSRGSTPDAEPSAGLTEFARNGVILATDQAHQMFGSATPGARAVELYRADEQDAANIADPLVRIAERRDGVGEMSPDSKDLLAAMMGIAAYATKQVNRRADANRIDARLAGGLEHPAADAGAAVDAA
jgi:hypothetical protein